MKLVHLHLHCILNYLWKAKKPSSAVVLWPINRMCSHQIVSHSFQCEKPRADCKLLNQLQHNFCYYLPLLCFLSLCCWHQFKLRRLGFWNQIVVDLDSKPSEFKCRFWSDSNLTTLIVPSIPISNFFRLNLTKFD